MTNIRTALTLLILSIGSSFLCGQIPADSRRQEIEELMKRAAIPGLSIAVIRDGETDWTGDSASAAWTSPRRSTVRQDLKPPH